MIYVAYLDPFLVMRLIMKIIIIKSIIIKIIIIKTIIKVIMTKVIIIKIIKAIVKAIAQTFQNKIII